MRATNICTTCQNATRCINGLFCQKMYVYVEYANRTECDNYKPKNNETDKT